MENVGVRSIIYRFSESLWKTVSESVGSDSVKKFLPRVLPVMFL